MQDIIEDFINRRFTETKLVESFLNGNCYYFAVILKERFSSLNLNVYYLAISGHFCVKNELTNRHYDITGCIDISNDVPYLLSDIKINEPSWYKRIVDGCIY